MINEIRITRLYDWPNGAVEELHNELLGRVPEGATVNTHMKKEVKVIIHDEWPKLKRERLKHDIVKTLDKAEIEHGLDARVESVEYVETDKSAGFQKANE